MIVARTGEADHPPRPHVAIAAVDGVREIALDRVLQQQREEGLGIGTGQFIEATYMAWDKAGNLYSGDTSVGRVTRMSRH